MYDFQQIETVRSFGDNIYTGKITINKADRDQSNVLENMIEFNNRSRSQSIEAKGRKEILIKESL